MLSLANFFTAVGNVTRKLARFLHIFNAGGSVHWFKVVEGVSDKSAKNMETLFLKKFGRDQLINKNSGEFTDGAATCSPYELQLVVNYMVHNAYCDYIVNGAAVVMNRADVMIHGT